MYFRNRGALVMKLTVHTHISNQFYIYAHEHEHIIQLISIIFRSA